MRNGSLGHASILQQKSSPLQSSADKSAVASRYSAMRSSIPRVTMRPEPSIIPKQSSERSRVGAKHSLSLLPTTSDRPALERNPSRRHTLGQHLVNGTLTQLRQSC